MSAPDPFDAPGAAGAPPRLLRAALVPAAFLAAILALDLAAWALDAAAIGVGALIVRVALFVGGLTACALAGGYALLRGPRSEEVAGLLGAGLGFLGAAIASCVPLFWFNP